MTMTRLTALVLTALLSLWGCGPAPTQQAGGGSDRPNAPAFTGVAATRDNAVGYSGGITLDLYRIFENGSGDYSWELAASTALDTGGAFAFDSLAEGYYSLLAYRDSLAVFSGYRYLSDTAVINLDTLRLEPLYTINGTLSDTAGLPVTGADLKLVGTPYICRIDTGGAAAFRFPAVAAGNYKMAIRKWPDTVMSGADTAGSYISVDGVSSVPPPDTIYESYYYDLPLNSPAATDTVTVTAGSVEVVGNEYIIHYSMQ